MGLGNLLGFGGGGIKPVGGVTGGMKPGQVLRKVDFSREKRLSRTGVNNALPSGILNTKVTTMAKKDRSYGKGANLRKGDKMVSHQKLEEENIIDLMRKKYIGKTSGQIERMIQKEKGIRIEDASQRVDYEFDIKDRKLFKNIVTGGDGPSREEVAADMKKQERFKRLNILSINRDREKDSFAAQLQSKRSSGQKKSIDIRNLDNTKINATNIGAEIVHSSVSALAGDGSKNKKNQTQPGFAGSVVKTGDEKAPDNVVSLDAHREAKSISTDPVFRTGTDG